MFFKKSKPKPDAARPQTATDMERPALAPEDKKMWVDGRNPHRTLTGDAAMALRPGDAHYKAYVGPPRRFDFMGATQFALLFHMGLRDHHTVLDFGCGSLRLGRSLIPYLQAGGYFGIDPNKWLIEDGIENELGQDGIQLKRPRFAYNTDFDCSIFGEKFDYIIAQSIFTHCGPNHFETFLERAAQALTLPLGRKNNTLVSSGLSMVCGGFNRKPPTRRCTSLSSYRGGFTTRAIQSQS